MFRCFSNSAAKSTSLGQGKFAQNFTILSLATGPGTPIPTPLTLSYFILLPFICSINIFDNF